MGYILLVATAVMLGDMDVAAEAVVTTLGIRPDFTISWASKNLSLTRDMRERFLDALRKAGVPEGCPALAASLRSRLRMC
jgi:hypothetical protein